MSRAEPRAKGLGWDQSDLGSCKGASWIRVCMPVLMWARGAYDDLLALALALALDFGGLSDNANINIE